MLCGDFNAGPDSDEIRLLTGQCATLAIPGLVFYDAWEIGRRRNTGPHLVEPQPARRRRAVSRIADSTTCCRPGLGRARRAIPSIVSSSGSSRARSATIRPLRGPGRSPLLTRFAAARIRPWGTGVEYPPTAFRRRGEECLQWLSVSSRAPGLGHADTRASGSLEGRRTFGLSRRAGADGIHPTSGWRQVLSR